MATKSLRTPHGLALVTPAFLRGAYKTALLKTSKTATALLVFWAIGHALGFVSNNLRAADQEQETKEPAGALPSNLTALRNARMLAARDAYDKVWDQYRKGFRDEEQVYRWSLRLLTAERELAGNKAKRLAALEGHLSRMKELEKSAPDRRIAVDAPVGGFGKGKVDGKRPAAEPRLQILIDKEGQTVGLFRKELRPSDVAVFTTFYRVEAEVWLAEAKAQ